VTRNALRKNLRSWPESRQEEKLIRLENKRFKKTRRQKRPGVKRDASRKNLHDWPESRQDDKLIWLESKRFKKTRQQGRPGAKRNALRKNLRNWPESRQEDKLIWLESKQLPKIRRREREKPRIKLHPEIETLLVTGDNRTDIIKKVLNWLTKDSSPSTGDALSSHSSPLTGEDLGEGDIRKQPLP
jgi:hypothetical protein